MNRKISVTLNIIFVIILTLSPLNFQQLHYDVQAQSASAPVTGRVTDGSDTGIEDVTIQAVQVAFDTYIPLIVGSASGSNSEEINSSGSQVNIFTVKTDSNGDYRLESLPDGYYKLTARKVGYDFDPIFYNVNTSSLLTSYNFQTTTIPLIYSANTHVLSEETLSLLIALENDGNTFTFDYENTELAQVVAGDIIIGGVSTLTPEGFLKSILSIQIQGDDLIINTEEAMFEEAFESLSIFESHALTPSDIQSITNVPGIRLVSDPAQRGIGDFLFEMSDAVLYDADGDISTIDDQVVANGLFSLSPDIEIRVRIENWEVLEFYTSSTMSIQSGFTVSSRISLDIDFLETKLMPTITMGVIQAGPVTIVPTLDLVASLAGSIFVDSSSSITNATSFTSGVWYVDGETQVFRDFTTNFSFEPPTVTGGVSFTASIGPKISAKLYGVLGAYVQAGFAARLEIIPDADPWLTLKAGFVVSVGVSLSVPILNTELFNLEICAISRWMLLYSLSSSTNIQPDPPSDPSPQNEAEDQSVFLSLNWTCSDQDGDMVVYDVYLDADNMHPTTKVSDHQIDSELSIGPLLLGTNYFWKVVAFDQHGAATSGPVWHFTTGVTSIEPIPTNYISLEVPSLEKLFTWNFIMDNVYDTLFVGINGVGDWPECSGSIESIKIESLDSDYEIIEEFNNPEIFTQVNSTVYISGGKAVFDHVYMSGGPQFIFRSIPKITGPFRITVIGQVDWWSNNCHVTAGISDSNLTNPTQNTDYYPGIMYGFFGGGCSRQGPLIAPGGGIPQPFPSDGCSFTSAAPWIPSGEQVESIYTTSN